MDAAEQIKRFGEFLETTYQTELIENIRKGLNYLIVDFSELMKFDNDLAEVLLEQPEESIRAAELAAIEKTDNSEIKNFKMRFKNLPPSQKIQIRNIRSIHIGKLYAIDGIVRQKSDVRPKVTSARFECPSCGNITTILQLDAVFKEPTRCSCGRKGKFRLLNKELVDAQNIVLEESPDELEGGAQPKRMNVFLSNDLVSPMTEKKTNPGSKILVVGFVKEVPIISKSGGKSTIFELLIEANSVMGVQEDYFDIAITEDEERQIKEIAENPKLYQILTNSLAPSIFGYEEIKEALILQLAGGMHKVRKDGVVSRGDIHILLVGDPGAGKSALLKRVAAVAPKGRYVAGRGVSGAGLTAAVVKDEFLKGWSLEAGALVLASNGTCCIDELDKMSNEDRSAMHEALEQQCFHYNTIITLANGEEKVIGDFVEEIISTFPERAVNGHDCIIVPMEDQNIEIFTTDWNKISKTKINRVSKHLAYDHFINICLCNGRKITVTPEHPVFVIENGQIITKRADLLKRNDSIPVPLILPVFGKNQKFCNTNLFNSRAINHIKVPMENGEEIYKIAGYLLSEGSKELNRGKLIGVNFTNKNTELIEDFEKCMFNEFNIKSYRQARIDDHEKRWMSRFISKELAEFFSENLPELLKMASEKEIPQLLMKGRLENISAMLSCMFEGDGHVSKKLRTIRVGFANDSRKMCEQVQDLLLRFSIRSNLTEHKESYKVSITGYENIMRFRECIGFISGGKNKIIDEYLWTKSNIRSVKENIPNVGNEIISLMEKYKIRKVGNNKICSMKHDYLKKNKNISRRLLQKLIALLEPNIKKEDENYLAFLKNMSFGEIGFEKINAVRTIKNNDQKWVYDVTVEPHHTFISQNMVLHNTVSISKANIQATLISRTTVLAAANPKLGRFNPFEMIAKQIDLPPTLINRFDLIFPIKDLPNPINDKKLARHILNLHQSPNTEEPEIPTKLLKKYMAYVKTRVQPQLTDGALEEIEKYYVDMRNNSGGSETELKSIPITARQLEALVRLSEAYARLRLADKVSRKDAKKATEMIHFCLSQVAYDAETKRFDIDKISTGISTSQRSNIITIKEIIADLEKGGKIIGIEEIVKTAKEQGIDESITEEVVEKLKRTGEIFEPRRGFVQRIV